MRFSSFPGLVLIWNINFILPTLLFAFSKVHHSFSEDDLNRIFHVNSHAEVPEYSIIRLHSRVRRNVDGGRTRTVRLKLFGREKVLNLRPNARLAKNVHLFYADPLENAPGMAYNPVTDVENTAVPYQDEFERAALMVDHHPDTGHLLLDGTIGEDIVMRPFPHHLHHLLENKDVNREIETSENTLPEYDDEIFLDDGENLEDDVIFSEGLPLAPDADSVQEKSVNQPKNNFGSLNSTSSLPEGLLLLKRKRRQIQGSQGFHVVYKRKIPALQSDYEFLENVENHHVINGKSRTKRSAPYVIYPEILVLVDYDGYLLHGQNNGVIKSYYVSFWNGVDLRYKLLKSPKVKISIAGIIISRSRDAMPYLERNQVGRDAIDSANALTDMGRYLYKERRLPTYDIAVAITKLDMCKRSHRRGICNRGTAGFAYVGGACVVNKRLHKVNSVAIVEDTGGFSGIIVAAHEVGHLLGAVHDGSGPPNYLGGPGARHCRWKDGYIMSDLRHTERGFRWSPCSTDQFHHFLNGQTATCLYNLPHEDESLPRVLPGKLLSLDEQCKKDRGTTACFKDQRVCAQLFCFDASSGFCVSYRPAAEGSDCGSGKICLNGKCVHDNVNSISDFDIHRSDIDSNKKQKNNNINDILSNDDDEYSYKERRKIKTERPEIKKYPTTKRYTTKKYKYTKKYLQKTTKKPYYWWTEKRNRKNKLITTTTTSRPTTYRPTTRRPTTTTRKTTKITRRHITTHRPTTTTHKTTTNKRRPTRYTKTVQRFNNGADRPKFITGNRGFEKDGCDDTLVPKPGSLSCTDFLTRFGTKYCKHRFIEEKCCYSQMRYCPKR